MAYADFDVLLSLTVSHSCEDQRVETSVEGITVYPPRYGVVIMVLIDGLFRGFCSTCGTLIEFHAEELKERL
jgi:hypothetical protein